jgi:hypothetical protein
MADPRTYFDALLALSGNALYDDTRQKLFRIMSDEDVNRIISYSLNQGPARDDREEIAAFLLDDIAKRATSDYVAGDALETAATLGE